jgi:mannose-6-phosphate isomerase class I
LQSNHSRCKNILDNIDLKERQNMNEILFLNPVFTHNIWGGTKLREDFGYQVKGDDIGECWGIAAHEHGDCTIREGRFSGMTLSEMWSAHPELFGHYKSDRFPLLVKIIAAKADLSIQVHPDDAYAAEHENGSYGKMECWYVLDCKADATIVIGHNARTKEELTDMIRNGRWSEFIREVPLKKGDFLQIDPGTVHAIKGGTILLETQQNSDITYRVYDYDRLSGGKPRPLHINQSIDVITVPAKNVGESIRDTDNTPKNTLFELIACPVYSVFKLEVDRNAEFAQNFPFLLASVVEGCGSINGQSVKKGDHMIFPYGYGEVCAEGQMCMILSAPNLDSQI